MYPLRIAQWRRLDIFNSILSISKLNYVLLFDLVLLYEKYLKNKLFRITDGDLSIATCYSRCRNKKKEKEKCNLKKIIDELDVGNN